MSWNCGTEIVHGAALESYNAIKDHGSCNTMHCAELHRIVQHLDSTSLWVGSYITMGGIVQHYGSATLWE